MAKTATLAQGSKTLTQGSKGAVVQGSKDAATTAHVHSGPKCTKKWRKSEEGTKASTKSRLKKRKRGKKSGDETRTTIMTS